MLASEYAKIIKDDVGDLVNKTVVAKPRGNGGAKSEEAFEKFKNYPGFPDAIGILCSYLEITGAYFDEVQNLAVSALPQRGNLNMGFVASAGVEEQLFTVLGSDGSLAAWQVSLEPSEELFEEYWRLLSEDEGLTLDLVEGSYESEPALFVGQNIKQFDKVVSSSICLKAIRNQKDYMHEEMHFLKRRNDWHNKNLWDFIGKFLFNSCERGPIKRSIRSSFIGVDDNLDKKSSVENVNGSFGKRQENNLLGANEKDFDVTKELIEAFGIIRNRPAQRVFRSKLLELRGRCELCGISQPEILEAAHIKPKSEGGEDSSENGLLLCRNHHKAFDAGLLLFDVNKRKLCWQDGVDAF